MDEIRVHSQIDTTVQISGDGTHIPRVTRQDVQILPCLRILCVPIHWCYSTVYNAQELPNAGSVCISVYTALTDGYDCDG